MIKNLLPTHDSERFTVIAATHLKTTKTLNLLDTTSKEWEESGNQFSSLSSDYSYDSAGGFTVTKDEAALTIYPRIATGKRLFSVYVCLWYAEATFLRFMGDPAPFAEIAYEGKWDAPTYETSIEFSLLRVPVEAERIYQLFLKKAHKDAKKKWSEREIAFWGIAYEKLLARNRDVIVDGYKAFISVTNCTPDRVGISRSGEADSEDIFVHASHPQVNPVN
jgi:hypothetical protein